MYGAERAILVLAEGSPDRSVVGCFDDPRTGFVELARVAAGRGIDSVAVPCAGAFDPMAVRRLTTVIRDRGIDVVHSHGYKASFYGLPAARMARRGFVVTLHGMTAVTRAVRVYEHLQMKSLALGDAVAAVSPALTERARHHAGDVPVRYVPNGIDVDRTCASAEGEAPTNGVYFAVVGRLAKEKGLDVLVEAVARIRDRLARHGARVVLMGDGPLRADLEVRSAALGVSSLVELRGFSPDPLPWMRHAIAVLMPSYTEGLPYTALEAMAIGTPLLATRVGALPELVEDDDSGLLVPAGDVDALAEGMSRLLEEPALRARLGLRGQQVVREGWGAAAMGRRYDQEVYVHARRV